MNFKPAALAGKSKLRRGRTDHDHQDRRPQPSRRRARRARGPALYHRPTWDRSPAGLRLFKCTICEHVGAGRVDTTALTCSRCGQIGTAALRCAASRAMTAPDLLLAAAIVAVVIELGAVLWFALEWAF